MATRVLLLNATYEPLALVSDRRAVILVLAGRAEAVAFRPDGPVFHSAHLAIDQCRDHALWIEPA